MWCPLNEGSFYIIKHRATLTGIQVWSQIWDHLPDTLLVFGQISINIWSWIKNKSVSEILFHPESIEITLNAVVNDRHFDRGCRFFCCYFLCHISNLNFRKDTFLNANSYSTLTSLNYPHSLQNGLTSKAVTAPYSTDGDSTSTGPYVCCRVEKW